MADVVLWLHGFFIGLIFWRPVHGFLERYVCRPLRCRLRMCGGRITSSEYGIGWQCATCGAIKHWSSWEKTLPREKANGK